MCILLWYNIIPVHYMEKTMPATVSELAQRDVRRATLTPEKLKGLAVTKSDVKKKPKRQRVNK